MNGMGMLVDLAHVSPSAFFNALEVTLRTITTSELRRFYEVIGRHGI
jgi:microsomal dipeptidase-like Zn-dependent dipeptidase